MEDAKRPTDLVQPARPDLEELRAQALDLLDFPAVRQQVAGYAGFPLARRLALGLEPAYSREEVEALQRETAEGVAYLAESSDISLYTSEDVAPLVERGELHEDVLPYELPGSVRSSGISRQTTCLSRKQYNKYKIQYRTFQ